MIEEEQDRSAMLRDGRLGGKDITRMTLQDVVEPAKPANAGFPVETIAGDFAVPGFGFSNHGKSSGWWARLTETRRARRQCWCNLV